MARASFPAASDTPLPQFVPFDGHARSALECAMTEAVRLGDDQVGTEHVLLGVLSAEDGAGVLAGLGLDRARAEAGITAAHAPEPQPETQPAAIP